MHFLKLSLFVLLLLQSFLHAGDKALEKVTLQLQWKHQFEFAGFYAAKEKGFYKDVGLDVSFVEFNTHTDITDEVLSGNAQYGVGYSSIIANYLNGSPLVLLANFFKQSPLVLVAQADIKTPADLKGKKIMGLSNSIHNITLFTMLNKFNIQSADIHNVPTSFNIDAFMHKKIDAMSVFTTNELYYLDKKGAKYTLFDPIAYGAKYYDANLFTSEKELQDHPERVENFRDASIKGWEYALAHQEEIIDLIIQKYNHQNKSREALLFEAKQIEYIMLPNIYKVGSIDNDRVKIIAENFIQEGFFKKGKHREIKDFIYTHSKNNSTLQLTPQEKAYLSEKKAITMCVDPDWMPFEKIKKGKYIGLGSDYMRLISAKLGIPVTLVKTLFWSQSLELAKKRECDILSMVAKNKKNEKYWDFTAPYIEAPLVMATKKDQLFIENIQQHLNQKWAVIKGYAIIQILKNKFPNIQIVEVDSVQDGLEQVEKGTLFGYIDNAYTVSYALQKEFIGSISIVGRIDKKIHYSIAVRNDEPLLHAILNKAIGSIGEKKKQAILNQWISVQEEKGFDYELFWYILTPFLLLALILLISHIILRQYNKQLKKEVASKIEELCQKDALLVKQYRMADMGEMLSMIAHQWRQPLGAISSAVMGIEVKLASGKFDLENKLERAKFLHYLHTKHQNINAYVQYLSSTTDDFRNFFNPNKNKDTVSLTTVIKNALKIMGEPMKSKGIKISTDYTVDIRIPLYKNEVMQVILNLLKNSEDNFREKKITDPKIHISTQRDKNHFSILLCDNGQGIPADIIEKIFEPYYSTKAEKNGAGLGLYMAKIIIEEHHDGLLTVKNREDGVCFEITFKV